MFDGIDDTIVAVASAPGRGARGIVRLSGPRALEISSRIASIADQWTWADIAGSRRCFAEIGIGDDLTVPGEVYVFRAPRSYTGQHGVEIHTLGAPPVLALVMEMALAAGARAAQPGEFSARAYLNGRMDLPTAEAVAATVRARSDAQLRAARRMMRGQLARRVGDFVDRIADLAALVEADIDFSEEPIDFVAPTELARRLEALISELQALLESAESGERIEALPRVMLVGAPNVGKSSLLNALSGLDRAIVSATMGTTRDVLSVPTRVNGAEVLLLDAAGLDERAGELAEKARLAACQAATTADLLCWVVDATVPVDPAVLGALRRAQAPACIGVINKIDLASDQIVEARVRELGPQQLRRTSRVSARTGAGLETLRADIADALGMADAGEDKAIALTARQIVALESGRRALQRGLSEARSIRETSDRAELIALELREALEALGEVSGQVTTEDLLGRVFASFCIGK